MKKYKHKFLKFILATIALIIIWIVMSQCKDTCINTFPEYAEIIKITLFIVLAVVIILYMIMVMLFMSDDDNQWPQLY